MEGVILAGGKGTRLYPLTAATNKHLVAVGKLPMIEYPLYTLRQMKVDSIRIVTGGEHFQMIAQYLTEVHKDIDFSFHPQKEAGGIAQALSLVEKFVKGDKIAVILGDNIFEDDFSGAAKIFEDSDNDSTLFLKEVPDPERFGVAYIENEELLKIEEKPKEPKSNLAVTGLYFYYKSVFDKIRKLKPSKRGELEITDINNLYTAEGNGEYMIIPGFWSDAGTHDTKIKCEEFVRQGLEEKVMNSIGL